MVSKQLETNSQYDESYMSKSVSSFVPPFTTHNKSQNINQVPSMDKRESALSNKQSLGDSSHSLS